MNYRDLFKNYIFPISTIAGSIIGVGFFSLPYIASKVGIWVMLFYFIVLTAIVLLIHLIFAQISLKTPDKKRFPGFVGYYLGKWPKVYSLLSGALIYFVVLLVYLIVGGQFLHSALSPFLGGSEFTYTLVYFTLACLIIYFGILAVSKFEFFTLLFLLVSFVLVFIKGFSEFSLGNIFVSNLFSAKFSVLDLFLPYGAIIFSLWGVGLIPEAEEMIESKKNFKKIVILATLIPAIFYVLFTLMVLGITGSRTTESALIGLNNFLGDGVVIISLLMGAVITFSAFVTHSLNLKKILIFDLKLKERDAFIITCFVPMILFLWGARSFIPLISFVGGIFLGIDGILILLMYKKIGGRKILIYPLSIVFLLGIIYEVIYFIK
jgi:amino acid permease